MSSLTAAIELAYLKHQFFCVRDWDEFQYLMRLLNRIIKRCQS